MLTTTLNEIRKCQPCKESWQMLLTALDKTKADNEILGFDFILASNGLRDAIWCLRTSAEGMKIEVIFVQWCAKEADPDATYADAYAAYTYTVYADATYADACAAYAYAYATADAATREKQKAKFLELVSEV